MKPRRTTPHRLITALALPATLLPALFFSFGCGNAGASEAKAAPAPEPIRVTAAAATSRVLPGMLAVTGALAADESADVAAERDGRVARVRVERGSFVEKGA